ncbi:hypothetical protein Rwratislav_31634 [Rhodococcus wratislaviensis IFP 2016]|nr:hypothetical protein Rwratislav_31634 [Rhodococcus wratislaviensis IFP 2016]
MSEALDPRGVQTFLHALACGNTDHLDRPRPTARPPEPRESTPADRLAAQLAAGYWRSLAEAARRAGMGYIDAAQISKADPRFKRRSDPMRRKHIELSLRAPKGCR